MNKELINKIEVLCSQYGEKIEDVSQYVDNLKRQKWKEQIQEKIREHQQYVYRFFRTKYKSPMFPEMYRYYYVVSSQSINEYHLECLAFDEYPYYWFQYSHHTLPQIGDYLLGEFEFESIFIENVHINNLKNYEEINAKTYWTAMRDYFDRLMDMPWCANHYRYGEKLPGDIGWDAERGKYA